MPLPRRAPLGLKLAAAAGLLFLHMPLAFIVLYAFTTEERSYQFPPPGLTLRWFAVAWERPDVWRALGLSLEVAALSTLVALVLGTLAAGGAARTSFFGREAISLLLVLPIALPGIITGISLRSAFNLMDIPFSFWTIVLGHATFCIVVVYNNAVARFRRLSPSLVEASMDLGADGFQTFRYVVLPNLGTALLAGGMLAFALSFDEVIVTTFTAGQQTTLPIWMLSELIRPRQRPVTNVVAVIVIAVTLLPILAAYYLTREGEPRPGADPPPIAKKENRNGPGIDRDPRGDADRRGVRARHRGGGNDPQPADRRHHAGPAGSLRRNRSTPPSPRPTRPSPNGRGRRRPSARSCSSSSPTASRRRRRTSRPSKRSIAASRAIPSCATRSRRSSTASASSPARCAPCTAPSPANTCRATPR